MSLNAGFELDEEIEQQKQNEDKSVVTDTEGIKSIPSDQAADVIFAGIDPGEVPDINDEVEIVSVVDGVKDLDYLKADILRSDGMSKTFALEAQKLIPDFITEERPLYFFTEFPSKTNYRLALEAIEEQKTGLFNRIFEAIKRFFKMAIEYLKSLKQKFTISKERFEDTQESYNQLMKGIGKVEKTKQMFLNPKNTVAKVKFLLKDMEEDDKEALLVKLQEILESGNEKLQGIYRFINRDNHAYAIISKSDIVDTLMRILNNAPSIIADFDALDVDTVRRYFEDSNRGESLERKVEFFKQRINNIASKQKLVGFKQYAESLTFHMKNRIFDYNERNMPLPKLLQVVSTKIDGRETVRLLDVVSDFIHVMTKTESSLIELFKTQSKSTTTEDAEKNLLVSEAMQKLHHEVRGLLSILAHSTELLNAWAATVNYVDDLVSYLRRRLKTATNELSGENQEVLMKYFDLEATAD